MLLIAAILVVGLLLGLGFGGSLRNLGQIQVRLWPAAPVALALQVIPIPQGESGWTRLLPMGVLLLSFVILMVVAAANRRQRGFGMILLGVALNLTVIYVNSGMPVTAEAVHRSGLEESLPDLRALEEGDKHHLASDDDELLFLADVIAVREPFGTVVSAGDLLVYMGTSMFLASVILGRPLRRDPEPPYPSPATTSGTPP